MKKQLIMRECEKHGGIWLIEKGAPSEFDPGKGLLIAHDCLEHFPSDNEGTIDNEFLALGAMIHVRGNTGHFRTCYSEPLCNELYGVLWYTYSEGNCSMKAPVSNIEIDELIELGVNESLIWIRNEYGDDECIDEEELIKFAESAKYWIQTGYNRAIRRYPDPWKTLEVFKQIEYQIDEIFKENEYFEGDEYELQYCISKATVSITKKEYEY